VDTKGCIKEGIKAVHSQPVAHNGIKGVLTSAYKEAGVRGLYRGVGMYPRIHHYHPFA
jgi:solute carrier family 25 protein 16